jgi:hypothetical protein
MVEQARIVVEAGPELVASVVAGTVELEEAVDITIEAALKMMPAKPPYSALRYRVIHGRSRVTLLRNQLKKAEIELTKAEAAVIAAAVELERITAAGSAA